MKYVVFFIALLGMIPLGIVSSASRKWTAAIVFCIFLPTIFFNQTALNFYSHEDYRGTARGMEVSVIYLLSLAVLIALAIRSKLAKMFPDAGAKIYFLYFVWSALSFYNSADPLLSWFELWKMIMIFLVFWAITSWLEASDDPKPIINSLAFFIVVNFLIIIRQHYSGRYQVPGCFPHQNSMTVFMMIIVPIFFAAYLTGKRSRSWWLYTAAFIGGSAAIVRSYSRGAIAIYPIAAGITAMLCLTRNFSQRIVSRMLPIALIGLLGFGVLLPRIVERFLYAPESSKGGRIDLALSARNMINDHPVLGVGLNNWGIKINPPYTYNARGLDWEKLSKDEDNPFRDGIVETIYLLVAAECGYPCLVLLLAFFGYYLFLAFRLTRRLAGTKWFFIAAGVAGGLAGSYLQSTLEWSLKQQIDFIGLMMVFAIVGYLNRHWRKLVAAERKEKEH